MHSIVIYYIISNYIRSKIYMIIFTYNGLFIGKKFDIFFLI